MDRVIIQLNDPGAHYKNDVTGIELTGEKQVESDLTPDIQAAIQKKIIFVVGPAPDKPKDTNTVKENLPPPAKEQNKKSGNRKTTRMQT